ncbi:MAG: DMT family transporter [Chloroflexota bacterium]
MTDTLRSYLALAFGILCIGFSAIFVRWADAPGPVAAFYRMSITALVLAIPFIRHRRRQARKASALPLTREEVVVALVGGLFFASDLVFWNTGILISGATNPTLMGNTAPLWVGLGALIFFREELPGIFWVGLTMAMAGAALVLGLDVLADFSLGLGTLFGLIAGIFYGGYFLITQRGRRTMDTLTYFWLAAFSASILLFIATRVLDQPLLGYSRFTYLNFLAMGLLVQVSGQFSFSYALGYLPASAVAPVGMAQPVATAILAWPLLGETISPLQAVGGVTVLAGVFIVQRSRVPASVGKPVEHRAPTYDSIE